VLFKKIQTISKIYCSVNRYHMHLQYEPNCRATLSCFQILALESCMHFNHQETPSNKFWNVFNSFLITLNIVKYDNIISMLNVDSSGFNSRAINVIFMTEKMALKQINIRTFHFFFPHQLSCHQCPIIIHLSSQGWTMGRSDATVHTHIHPSTSITFL
jgi:hypothetical protein